MSISHIDFKIKYCVIPPTSLLCVWFYHVLSISFLSQSFGLYFKFAGYDWWFFTPTNALFPQNALIWWIEVVCDWLVLWYVYHRICLCAFSFTSNVFVLQHPTVKWLLPWAKTLNCKWVLIFHLSRSRYWWVLDGSPGVNHLLGNRVKCLWCMTSLQNESILEMSVSKVITIVLRESEIHNDVFNWLLSLQLRRKIGIIQHNEYANIGLTVLSSLLCSCLGLASWLSGGGDTLRPWGSTQLYTWLVIYPPGMRPIEHTDMVSFLHPFSTCIRRHPWVFRLFKCANTAGAFMCSIYCSN